MTTFTGTADRPPFHIDYGSEVEPEVVALAERIAADPALSEAYQPRWLAIKLLEGESDLLGRVREMGGEEVLAAAEEGRARIEAMHGDTADIAIADARYGYVHGVVREVVDTSGM